MWKSKRWKKEPIQIQVTSKIRRIITLKSYKQINPYKYQKMEARQTIHNRLSCLVIIQITRVVVANDKVKRNINNILLTDKQIAISKKNRHKLNNLCGRRNWDVPSKQIDQQKVPIQVNLGWINPRIIIMGILRSKGLKWASKLKNVLLKSTLKEPITCREWHHLLWLRCHCMS